MLHSIPAGSHGPLGQPMAEAVSKCVHCGFCLAACPTYRQLGQEMDSPRGRILLMKEALEGQLPWEDAQPHVDRCLGCLACEPACPSGVPYRDLISPFRSVAQSRFRRPPFERLRRWLIEQTLPYPERFEIAARLGRLARPVARWMPPWLRPLLEMLPAELPPRAAFPAVTRARGSRRARVALLTGCAQQVLDPDINTATLAVLAGQGVEVVVPASQGCCGGLSWHVGNRQSARDFARRNLEAFPSDVDAILTNAAGCGSALHEYPLILRGTDDEDRARRLASRTEDVTAFLARIGFRPPSRPVRWKIAYQDACHLANAQGVRHQPRDLLRSIPGLELLELADSDQCCGSAGTYNVDHPELAAALGERKARAVIDTGADGVVSGNIGCLNQLRHHLQRMGSRVTVRHTLQCLWDAFDDRHR